jgi:hypothetical protein
MRINGPRQGSAMPRLFYDLMGKGEALAATGGLRLYGNILDDSFCLRKSVYNINT